MVDFFPRKLEDFACLDNISDYGEPVDDEESGVQSISEPNASKWEWRFCLVVEDGRAAPKGIQKEQLELYVFQRDAEYLLGLDAEEYVFLNIHTSNLLSLSTSCRFLIDIIYYQSISWCAQ